MLLSIGWSPGFSLEASTGTLRQGKTYSRNGKRFIGWSEANAPGMGWHGLGRRSNQEARLLWAMVRLWDFILNGRTEDVQRGRVTCYDLHLLKSVLLAMWTIIWKVASVIMETD